jgi:glutathione-regulated potassium-efflux system ancillary protein KefC
MFEALIFSALILISGILSMEMGIATALIELCTGIVLAHFFHSESIAWLGFFSTLGSAMLMFLAGLETDLLFIRQNRGSIVALGGLSFLAPAILTGLFGLQAGWGWQQSALISIAASSTSMSISFPTLSASKINQTAFGRGLLSVAFVADFLVVLGVTLGFTHYNLRNVLVLLFLPVFMVLFRMLINFSVQRYAHQNAPEAKFRTTLAVLIAISFLAEGAQIPVALVAFVFGILMSRDLPEDTRLKIKGAGFGIFIPAFFFQAGLSVNLGALADHWQLLIALIALAFPSKFLAIWLGGKNLFGQYRTQAALLSSTRLTFGVIATNYGVQAGIINQDVYSVLLAFYVVISVVSLVLFYIRGIDLQGALAIEEGTLARGSD